MTKKKNIRVDCPDSQKHSFQETSRDGLSSFAFELLFMEPGLRETCGLTNVWPIICQKKRALLFPTSGVITLMKVGTRHTARIRQGSCCLKSVELGHRLAVLEKKLPYVQHESYERAVGGVIVCTRHLLSLWAFYSLPAIDTWAIRFSSPTEFGWVP